MVQPSTRVSKRRIAMSRVLFADSVRPLLPISALGSLRKVSTPGASSQVSARTIFCSDQARAFGCSATARVARYCCNR
jgi:hypothetical protein